MHLFTPIKRVSWITGLTVTVLVVCCGCDQDRKNSTGPKAKAGETWQYWEAFNKAAVAGTGVELLPESKNTDLKVEDLANIFRDIAAAEKARHVAITSLPVLYVDSNLTAYAIQFAKARADIAGILTDYANLLDQQRQVTSGPNLAMSFIMGLLNHRNKEEGVVWNALIDTATQTGNELQQARPAAQQLEARVMGIRDGNARLKTEEMRVRVSLSQKYEREYPPIESYFSSKSPVIEMPLDEKKLMQDLLGKRLDRKEWTSFDSLDEFVSFKITNTEKRDDGLVDYEVKTHLKGIVSGREWDFRLRLTYRKIITRWQFVSVKLIE